MGLSPISDHSLPHEPSPQTWGQNPRQELWVCSVGREDVGKGEEGRCSSMLPSSSEKTSSTKQERKEEEGDEGRKKPRRGTGWGKCWLTPGATRPALALFPRLAGVL